MDYLDRFKISPPPFSTSCEQVNLGCPSPTGTASTLGTAFHDAVDPDTVSSQTPEFDRDHRFCAKSRCERRPNSRRVQHTPEEEAAASLRHSRWDAISKHSGVDCSSISSNAAVISMPYVSPGLEASPSTIQSNFAEAASLKRKGAGGTRHNIDEDESNIYPRPLALSLIIIGLCLSVFLISLDRTIITTVRNISPL